MSRVVGDIVIAEDACRNQTRTDRVRTAYNALTRSAAVGGAHAIRRYETCERSRKGRIGIAIDLVRCIWCHRRSALIDRELSRVVSDVVIAKHARRSQARTNRVRTAYNALTRRAAVGRSYAIRYQESCELSGKRRIGIAINLVRRIRRYRRIALIDGKLSAVVSDIVFGQHASCRAQRCGNVIGRRTGILA